MNKENEMNVNEMSDLIACVQAIEGYIEEPRQVDEYLRKFVTAVGIPAYPGNLDDVVYAMKVMGLFSKYNRKTGELVSKSLSSYLDTYPEEPYSEEEVKAFGDNPPDDMRWWKYSVRGQEQALEESHFIIPCTGKAGREGMYRLNPTVFGQRPWRELDRVELDDTVTDEQDEEVGKIERFKATFCYKDGKERTYSPGVIRPRKETKGAERDD